jgi:CubicO group peptidase (beta-lactamase class C family)
MMSFTVKFFLLLFFSGLQVFGASEIETRLQQAYDLRKDNGDITGMSLGYISTKEEFLLKQGDARSSLAYEIGSISKSFAGIALAQLSVHGKIELEAPISRYLPELHGTFSGTITALQLATHSAKLSRTGPAESSGEILEFLKSYSPTENQPAVLYSNFGYAVISLLIERVSGVSYMDFVDQEIFSPLEMYESGFLTSNEVRDLLITPRNIANEEEIMDLTSSYRAASGGIYSTLSDMQIFLKLNLFPETYPTLTEAVKLSQTKRLGWDNKEGQKLTWKNGMMSGFTSFMGMNLETKEGVIALNNNRFYAATEELALIALGWDIAYKKQHQLSDEFIASVIGDYDVAKDPQAGWSHRIEVSQAGKLIFRIIDQRAEKEVVYTYRLMSLDGIKFRAYNGFYDVPMSFEIDPQTGARLMIEEDFGSYRRRE